MKVVVLNIGKGVEIMVKVYAPRFDAGALTYSELLVVSFDVLGEPVVLDQQGYIELETLVKTHYMAEIARWCKPTGAVGSDNNKNSNNKNRQMFGYK